MADVEDMTLSEAAESAGAPAGGEPVAQEATAEPEGPGAGAGGVADVDASTAHEMIRAMLAQIEELKGKAAAAADFEPYRPIMEDLKRSNFASAKEFNEDQDRQRSERELADDIKAQQGRAAAILMETVNSGGLDITIAEQMYELRKDAIENKVFRDRYERQLKEMKLDKLKDVHPNMDREWVIAQSRINVQSPIEKIAAESHKRETAKQQAFLASYNAAKATDVSATKQTPEGGGVSTSIATRLEELGKLQGPAFAAAWDKMMKGGGV